MKCVRCNKEFNSTIPERNAESYGDNLFACPYCGKLYLFYRSVRVKPIEHPSVDKDDWDQKVIK